MTAHGARPVILVADDEADILELIALRLERSGFEVLRASDGARALGLAVEQSPDLVVLDVMMPRLTGVEVTRLLRKNESTRDLPILLLTARVQEDDVERGLAAGADDYVQKPFSPRDLETRVRELLDAAHAAQPSRARR